MPPKAPAMDVTALLHQDHQLVRELFFDFSKTEDEKEQDKLAKQILTELFIHAKVEEEIVYPVLDEEGEEAEDLKDEAENEHQMVKYMMAEIYNLKPGSDELKAKITVLCELVEHHVGEEEKEMFKMLRESGSDLQAMAKEVEVRKAELKKEGLPEMKSTLTVGNDTIESAKPEKSAKPSKGKVVKAARKPSALPAQKPRRKSA